MSNSGTLLSLAQRALAENIRAMTLGSPEMPEVSKSLVEWLEAVHPPRCRDLEETEREHERYAGKVELVAAIRAQYDRVVSFGLDEEEIVEEARSVLR